MLSNMCSKNATRRETFITIFTFIRSLARMHSQMLKNINCIAGILQETSKILTGDDGHSALILIWHLCVHNTAMLITNRI